MDEQMIATREAYIDETSVLHKLFAALTGFGFACCTFFFSAIVLLPATVHLTATFEIPSVVTTALVLFELFGLTAIAGVFGVAIFAKGLIQSNANFNGI